MTTAGSPGQLLSPRESPVMGRSRSQSRGAVRMTRSMHSLGVVLLTLAICTPGISMSLSNDVFSLLPGVFNLTFHSALF